MAKAKKLPSGNWRTNLYIGTEGGKRKYKSFTAPTKKESEYMAARYAATKQEDNKSNLTMGKAISNYIDSKENIHSPSTIRAYKSMLKNNCTKISDVKIKDVTQEIVQTSVNEYAINHSPKTCRNYHSLISAVLKIHRPEMILRTTLPQKGKKDIYVPDQQEVENISELAVGTSIYIPFLLATQCGLRASEICGLELKDVHSSYIEIKQARVLGTNGEVLKQPKSVSGYRKIPIDEALYKILVENADGERVCKTRTDTLSSAWCKFRKQNNLNKALNFHALRHTMALILYFNGMDGISISGRLGHSKPSTTSDLYSHIIKEADKQSAECIADAVLRKRV